MRQIKEGKIKLKKIKHLDNSRLRDTDDVSELMHDIEQHGLLQPVAIRSNDNALIFGNRRVKAFEKLGYEEIPCFFYDDVSDSELLILNIIENIKRKNIGSIEIGRACKKLRETGMTNSEIAEKLNISKSRVEGSIRAFEVVVGTPFEKLVIFGKLGSGKARKGIPETLIWKIQNSLSRARRLTKDDWDALLNSLERGELTTHHITQLRKILMFEPQLSIQKAMEILSRCRIVHLYIHFNSKVLAGKMKEEKCESEQEFLKTIIKKYSEDLIF